MAMNTLRGTVEIQIWLDIVSDSLNTAASSVKPDAAEGNDSWTASKQ